MPECIGTLVLFILGIPSEESDLARVTEWLKANAPYALEITEGAELPYLLLVDKTSSKPYDWEDELQAMGVSTLSDNLGYSNRPDEAVYVMGHPDFSQGCELAFVKYVKWLHKRSTFEYRNLIDAKTAARSNQPVPIGTILVHDTCEREPLIQEISQFGPVRLEFIDFQHPYID